MAKFITIGYGDREGYERTSETVRSAAHAHDELLLRRGADMGIAGQPVQVRNHGAKGVHTEAGSFMSSRLPIAGFAIIEASDIAEAIELVSKTPCAVAYGVVEVWPMAQQDGAT
ncbi:YciI family protein [Pseudoduganella plicata]|uniref:Transcription initiation protein n=1 Tax=Pseudoduganella plicata TaxID=321984 RepID=A0A4V1ATM3_9BURK|nr:YciI family protein [Pseudoduganella plicata]QBQ36168.1 transcription initiation protein [Pseudoduganella plicata]GGY77558.1 hypothetical protein GCM10007388_07950 [Pseudoduganella plicata]